jgi:TolA-binding protein
MKRILLFLTAGSVWFSCNLMAQGNDAIEAALERKANEERFNRLNKQVADLQETQELLLQRLARMEQRLESLGREIDKTKEENLRSKANLVTRDEFKTYVDKLQEIDRKREADNELIRKSLNALAKLPATLAPEPKSTVDPEAASDTRPYKVQQAGETLGDIRVAWNNKFKEEGRRSISLDQIKKANPNLNPDKIRVGQTILIPVPPKK